METKYAVLTSGHSINIKPGRSCSALKIEGMQGCNIAVKSLRITGVGYDNMMEIPSDDIPKEVVAIAVNSPTFKVLSEDEWNRYRTNPTKPKPPQAPTEEEKQKDTKCDDGTCGDCDVAKVIAHESIGLAAIMFNSVSKMGTFIIPFMKVLKTYNIEMTEFARPDVLIKACAALHHEIESGMHGESGSKERRIASAVLRLGELHIAQMIHETQKVLFGNSVIYERVIKALKPKDGEDKNTTKAGMARAGAISATKVIYEMNEIGSINLEKEIRKIVEGEDGDLLREMFPG